MTAKIIPFSDKEPICAFCKTPKSKAKKFVVSSSGMGICDKCLKICKEKADAHPIGSEQ